MSTSPRFFTDPLAGASYSANQVVTIAHLTAYFAGARAIDLAHEIKLAANWPPSFQQATVNWDGALAAVWDPTYHWWVVAYQLHGTAADPQAAYGWPHMGSLTAASTQPAANLTVKDMCCGSDTTWVSSTNVIVGDPTTTSAVKARYSSNGGVDWGSSTFYKLNGTTAADTVAVNAVCHHYTSGIGERLHGAAVVPISRYVAGAQDGKIYLSNPAVSIARFDEVTNANANAISALNSNGFVIVGVSSALTNKCVVSHNGTDWDQRVMATTASWYDVCWIPQQKRWAAVGVASGQIVINVSSDAITWTAVTPTGAINRTYTPKHLLSTGNLLVLTTLGVVYISSDLGATWRLPCRQTGGWDSIEAAAVATDDSQVVSQVLLGGSYGTATYTVWSGSLVVS